MNNDRRLREGIQEKFDSLLHFSLAIVKISHYTDVISTGRQ